MTTIRDLRSCLLAAAALAACAGEDKPKLDVSGGSKGELVESISHLTGPSWREVEVVESAHPYRNNFTRRWDVTGSEDALEMAVVFSRFDLETGYDVLTISDAAGGQRTTHTGEKTGTEVLVSGNRVNLQLTTDSSVTRWGFRLQVFERTPCACIELYDPVCGADGRSYNNSCFAACEGVDVTHRGQCSNVWLPIGTSIESPHPYANNYSNTWTISEGGASRIRVHFSRIDLERGYDHVTVLDANDRVVARYTGSEPNGLTSPVVEGDTVKIRLDTDYSVTRWGFGIDSYEVQGGCNSDAECGSGETCVQVECIRAPCFAMCMATPSSYLPVAVASLDQDPAAFDGRLVSVIAEPSAPAAVCTKIACSPANPCCNRCASSLQIGDGIELNDATGSNTYGCTGNECTWDSQCNPFPAAGAGQYELRGTFTFDAFSGAKVLRVDGFTAQSCAHTGCSGNLCANGPVFSTCVFRPEFACYQAAECTAQADGFCGFTETPELTECLANGGPGGATTISATDTPVAIPDDDARGASSTIRVPAQRAQAVVRVSARITHTYRGDLRVVLVQPDGREHVLHDRTGGSFDDLEITDHVVGELDASAIGGDWTLQVYDLEAVDTGTLQSFSISM